MNMATADVPALRLVWWQMLALELAERLAGPGGESTGLPGWVVALDDKERLRYDAAGLTLTPDSLWVRCEPVQAIQVRLAQSVWFEGMALTLTVTADQALTVECFERLSQQMTAKGWQVNNAPVFSGTLAVEDGLLIPPTTLVSELQDWASEVAAMVTDAIEGLHHILHGGESGNTSQKACAALPGFLVMAADAKLLHHGHSSNDAQLGAEGQGKPAAVASVDDVIDMTECLAWMGETIEAHLRDRSEPPPTSEAP